MQRKVRMEPQRRECETKEIRENGLTPRENGMRRLIVKKGAANG